MPIDVTPFETLSAAGLVAADLPPRTPLLSPLLQRESLTLLLGPRGIGKSFTALGIARAVAAGEPFLDWTPPAACSVTYVDGELAGVDLQQRLKSFGPPPDLLEFVIRGIRGHRVPDLSSDEGWQALVQPWRSKSCGPNLLVLDSLSSLTGGNGKEAANWPLVRRMLFSLRAVGIAVLLVHTGTAKGVARGPRQREDLFDTIVSLRRPDDFRPGDGLRYELHFEKARGLYGDDVKPFQARMETDEGRALWQRRPIGSDELHRVAKLLNEGLNPLQVAKQLGLSKSKTYRLQEKASAAGLTPA